MKFVHIADMHFDAPFTNLSDKEMLGDLMRLEQRKVFKKVIEYIKENFVEYLFIAGDLYEQKYVRKSTIEYINNLFKEIPKTKIFIAPGNHDPYIKNSYYYKFDWNKNVKIFTSKIEKVKLGDINIYGYGFNDFYCEGCGIEDFKIEDYNLINIFVVHGSLDCVSVEDKQYNPMFRKDLREKGFDYVALGHIHKIDYNHEEKQRIVYPGSMISGGFDELGKHGMIVGELNKDDIKLEFIPLADIEFKIKEIEVTYIFSKEELIEKINELVFKERELIEIILTGKRNFQINLNELHKLITNSKVIKIKDKTKINYDLKLLSNEKTLKGLFVKQMLDKLQDETITEEYRIKIEKAMEIGLEALQ